MDKRAVGVDLGSTKVELGFIDPQNQIIERCKMPTNPDVNLYIRIVPSELGDDAPLLGCSWLARQILNYYYLQKNKEFHQDVSPR